jgi:hypothetical protein
MTNKICPLLLKGRHNDFTWRFEMRPVYCAKDEEFNKAGTDCALFDIVITADRLGGEGLSDGPRAVDGQHAAKIVNYAIAEI